MLRRFSLSNASLEITESFDKISVLFLWKDDTSLITSLRRPNKSSWRVESIFWTSWASNCCIVEANKRIPSTPNPFSNCWTRPATGEISFFAKFLNVTIVRNGDGLSVLFYYCVSFLGWWIYNVGNKKGILTCIWYSRG